VVLRSCVSFLFFSFPGSQAEVQSTSSPRGPSNVPSLSDRALRQWKIEAGILSFFFSAASVRSFLPAGFQSRQKRSRLPFFFPLFFFFFFSFPPGFCVYSLSFFFPRFSGRKKRDGGRFSPLFLFFSPSCSPHLHPPPLFSFLTGMKKRPPFPPPSPPLFFGVRRLKLSPPLPAPVVRWRWMMMQGSSFSGRGACREMVVGRCPPPSFPFLSLDGGWNFFPLCVRGKRGNVAQLFFSDFRKLAAPFYEAGRV